MSGHGRKGTNIEPEANEGTDASLQISPSSVRMSSCGRIAHETVQEALNRTRTLVECSKALLFHVDGEVLRINQPAITVPASDSLLGYVASTGVCVIVPDVGVDPRFTKDFEEALGQQNEIEEPGSLEPQPQRSYNGRTTGRTTVAPQPQR